MDRGGAPADDKEFERADERDGRRFDLLCILDDARIMILELMRPGKPADYDHLSRLNRYVTRVSGAINQTDTRSGHRNKAVRGLLIADRSVNDRSFNETLSMLSAKLDVVTWDRLFRDVSARYKEFLELLRLKSPDDPRLRGLVAPRASCA